MKRMQNTGEKAEVSELSLRCMGFTGSDDMISDFTIAFDDVSRFI